MSRSDGIRLNYSSDQETHRYDASEIYRGTFIVLDDDAVTILRLKKDEVLVLEVGSWVKPCVTPDDPDRVTELLKARVPAS
jgi:hypothetical protein